MAWAILASEEYMKQPLPTPLIHTTLLTLLNVLLQCVLELPFFIALKQMLKKLQQQLTPATLTMGQYIFHSRYKKGSLFQDSQSLYH